MAKYYKVTNVSGAQKSGPRNIFLVEAGKLLKPGDSAYNLNRLSSGTVANATARGLEILMQDKPFKDPTIKIPEAEPPKTRHQVFEAPPLPPKKEATPKTNWVPAARVETPEPAAEAAPSSPMTAPEPMTQPEPMSLPSTRVFDLTDDASFPAKKDKKSGKRRGPSSK